MPVHRETLIAYDELETAKARVADAVDRLRDDVLERDVEKTLARIDELRERVDELEATILRTRR